MDIGSLRHGKEKTYGLIAMIVGGIAWTLTLILTSGLVLLFLIPIAIVLFVVERLMQTVLFGNSVQVTESQFPEINQIIQGCSSDYGLSTIPKVFVVNSEGATNALAIKFLKNKYVLVYSEMVDLMGSSGGTEKLKMILAHELAHHAAGHVNFFRSLLIKPAYFIPFLGAAYGRACELTADRLAAAWVGDEKCCKEALVILACGSEKLSSTINVDAFKEQEALVPPILGFLHELFSSHPRMTRRVIEIENYFTHSTMAPAMERALA